MQFEEVQALPKGWTMLSALPGVALVVISLIASSQGQPVPASSVVLTLGVTLVLGVWLRKMALITTVNPDTITLRFRGLFKTRTVPISSVKHAQARTYKPLREYGGWGIKAGPSGWTYNVSGHEGVQLKLSDAKPLLIGSRRPEELAEAITASPNYKPGD